MDLFKDFFKMSKWDKIGISVIFITFAIFSFCSCFAFDNSVPYTDLGTFSLVGSLYTIGSSIKLSSGSAYHLVEIPSYYGYDYKITYHVKEIYQSETFFRLIKFSEFPVVGSEGILVDYVIGSPGDDLEINYHLDTNEKLYLVISTNGWGSEQFADNLKVTTNFEGNGMNLAINNLIGNLSVSNIWDTFKISIPFIAVVILVVFGFYLVFHNISEISKGKEKM